MKHLFSIVILIFLSASALSQEKSRPEQPDLPGELMIDFGFNMWDARPADLPGKFIGSHSFGIYYNNRVRFNDHISFHPGAGFTFDKYAFTGNYTWVSDLTNGVALDSMNAILTKNKLAASYFEVPLEFRIHPLGTVNGEGWFIGLGVIGGVRMNSHTKIKYKTTSDVKDKLYNNFDLNRIRYGYQIRFGFKTVHLFYKSYLSDLFNHAPDASGISPKVTTIGITFSGF